MAITSLTVNVAGTDYPILEGSFKWTDRIDERSRCSFVVYDQAGTASFLKGQLITVTDLVQGLFYAGFVSDANPLVLLPNTDTEHTVDCVDLQELAGGITSNKLYNGMYAGAMCADMLKNHLAAEGITAQYAIRNDSSQSDFAAGTLSNTTASTLGDGDLELSKAGSDFSLTLATQSNFSGNDATNYPIATQQVEYPSAGGLQLLSSPGLYLKAQETLTVTNAYIYAQFWNGSYVIQSGDTFSYDVWVPASSVDAQTGMDLWFSDGTSLRDVSGIFDQQAQTPHPNTDLKRLAVNQWYSRSFTLTSLAGKTLNAGVVAFEGQTNGQHEAYFRNAKITNGVTTQANLMTVMLYQPISAIRMQNGYASPSLSRVTVYEQSGIYCIQPLSVASVGIVRDSLVSWSESSPNGTAITVSAYAPLITDGSGAYGFVELPATNRAALPGWTPGTVTTSQYFSLTILLENTTNAPTITPVLGSITAQIFSSYVSAKTDNATREALTSAWNAGTFSNTFLPAEYTASSRSVLALNWTADFDETMPGILFGSNVPGRNLNARELQLFSNGGTDAKIQFTEAGTFTDVVAGAQVHVPAVNCEAGIVYATTFWGNANNTFAYVAYLSPGGVYLARGSNSSTGSFTALTSYSIALTTGDLHYLEVRRSGNTHVVYLDYSQVISFSDSTFTSAGYVGLRMYNGASSGTLNNVYFSEFGVGPALSGTWTSPAINISSLSTIDGSVLHVQQGLLRSAALDTQTPAANDSDYTAVQAAISLNNGSSYTDISPESTIAGLTAGTNVSSLTQVRLKLTLSTTLITKRALVSAAVLHVLGHFSSSGTRVSPVLSLATAGRAGSTLVSWNSNVPTGTTLTVETSPDSSTWTSTSNGGSIAGITSQPAATLDTFDSNSSSSYTSTARSGGTSTTWTWDTTNSRITVSGGTNAILLRNSLSAKDIEIVFDIEQAESAGLVWRYQNTTNFYELDIADASASSAPNTLKLYKVVSNVKTQLGTTQTITFTRGKPYRARISMIGTALIVYFDGVQKLSLTESSISTAGSIGFINGSSAAHFYNLHAQPQGDDLTGKNAYTRVSLGSTDPTLTPQLLDLFLGALSPNIGIGALIPTADYRGTYLDRNFDDLTKKSNYFWMIKPNKDFVFNARTIAPAPWVLTGDDTLIADFKPGRPGSTYRNRQRLTGVVDTIVFEDDFTGDGKARSWALSYKLASAPTVMVNGQVKTVGLKGVDSGKDYYWASGESTLIQDSAGALLILTDQLVVDGLGTYVTEVVRNNTAFTGTVTQSQYATRTGGTGIVEAVEDVSDLGLNIAAANAYGDALLQRNGNPDARAITFRTLRDGLRPGQYLPVFNTPYKFNDAAMLITSMDVEARATMEAGQKTIQYWYRVNATEGVNLGSWAKLMSQAFQPAA